SLRASVFLFSFPRFAERLEAFCEAGISKTPPHSQKPPAHYHHHPITFCILWGMELLAFLKQKNLFTEEECIEIDDAFEREIIPKGEVIQKISRYSQRILFIEAGILRVFYTDEGKDITHFYFEAGHFIAPIYSIYFNQSERYEWEAVEACRVRVVSYETFLGLEERYPKLTRVLLDFAIYMLDLFSQKLNLLQFQTAYDRYNLFLEMYPNLHHRVSLGSIASFLGVTQQTLSVIRGKKK
ncbi:MAG: Crp/Fnr family transcriptional regulator, partial [Bacteroidota bacterium]